MSIWEECLGNAPTETLALISLHLATKQHNKAIHLIQLYGAVQCLGVSGPDHLRKKLRDDETAIIQSIEEIIAFRCSVVQKSQNTVPVAV